MSDVYVSYSHIDGETVRPLIEDLRRRVLQRVGKEVTFWMDVSHIEAGSDWQEALNGAMAAARMMLAIVSPAYLQSRFARSEFESFERTGRPIVPVVLEELHPNKGEVEALIGTRKWFVGPNTHSETRDERHYELVKNLAEGIINSLDGTESAPRQSPPQDREGPSATERPQQQAKGYVFLSYAEEDADFLAALRAFFGERGYAYWEFESSDRDYQKRIDLELEAVISGAVATVSILSEAWKASTWSLRELFFSQDIGKPVFLLKAKPISPTLAIAGFPYIDFTKDSQQAYTRLARELQRAGL